MALKVPRSFAVEITLHVGRRKHQLRGTVYGTDLFDAMDNIDEGDWNEQDKALLDSLHLDDDKERDALSRSVKRICFDVTEVSA